MTITLITGANKGLGYETARRLLEQGYIVYLRLPLGLRHSVRHLSRGYPPGFVP